ncbi:ADP-L-glycero-D-manno-heptose-6-epimerase [Hydrogenobacter thermophilus TK-6]|uniref:ADP-L-glycero-D-manno-heptose-6-epimerase n=1 Tax=Hydrogenobacter thermophilus (strain DSM 6534 / IAM 12695 / TK-6) TaxID=608538 RepID=D3DG09_HYDTT|nr:ADP-glyceromanno-heptose 6-epimerase [Hydrogenobacter thermophilus]ADO44696.1 ADP-L-glycero-D-manno-heptose-6-epimerase [Hydrogenobacter thermophilus TK-6]BAI68761.1 ADP-L-glycero-D-manno-heptose-6-epimerase [Hydrogenobacter thermophilus TK-6]
MRVLITGGAGFIGSNIAKQLERSYPNAKVYVLDDFSSGHFKNLIGFRGEVITGNISDPSLWEWLAQNYQFDVVFHKAAITDTTIMDQALMMKTNADSFRHLLKCAVKWKAKVIYASSAGVYGNVEPPMREEGPQEPENVYGFSKLIMDRIALNFLEEHKDIKLIGFRYFNVYGEGESYKGKTASMVYQLYKKIASGEKARLFKWGEQRRDFVYIKDVIKANMLALEKDVSGIFNIATGESRSFNEIVDILSIELNTKPEVEYFDCPYDFYQQHTQADISKAREVLGYTPDFSLEDGIRDYIKVLRA